MPKAEKRTAKSEQRKANSEKRRVNRRRFLAGAGAVSAGAVLGAAAPGSKPGSPLHQVNEFDWILPEVAEVILAPQGPLPSIADTEVDRFARERFTGAGQAQILELALAGVAMETEAMVGTERGFGDLTADEKNAVVEAIRTAETTSPAWLAAGIAPDEFYRQLRFHLVDGYYSHPAVQAAIGFPGAAQFVGHPDFTEMPEPGPDQADE